VPLPTPMGESAAVKCAKFASPAGSDGVGGSRAHPYRTIRRLLGQLRPGQTGCLLSGTFQEDVTVRRGGVVGRPITLTSARGAHATIKGVFWITRSASDLVVSRLTLDGSTTGGAPSPQVNGTRIVFRLDNVTNRHTAICFILGGDFPRYGTAIDPVIAWSHIHDCGRKPATGLDQGVYVEGTRGARVIDNVIYRNADWGVQLYPDAQGTYVAHNIIEGNGGGVIIGGGNDDGPATASSHNIIDHNVIADSVKSNLASYWQARAGTGNVVRANCLWGGQDGGIDDEGGISLVRNVRANPEFVDRAAADFRMRRSSRCLRVHAGL
jgi:parallel beta-helix repeat protein